MRSLGEWRRSAGSRLSKSPRTHNCWNAGEMLNIEMRDNFTMWAYSVTKLEMCTCPAGCGKVGKYVKYLFSENTIIPLRQWSIFFFFVANRFLFSFSSFPFSFSHHRNVTGRVFSNWCIHLPSHHVSLLQHFPICLHDLHHMYVFKFVAYFMWFFVADFIKALLSSLFLFIKFLL